MTQRTLAATILAIAIMALSTPTMAGDQHKHDDHKHSHSKHDHGPKHGGQYVEVKGHHGVEMIAGSDVLVFHLSEDGKPMDLAGSSFRAVVQSKAGNKILSLTIKGTSLSAALDAPLPKGAKIALTGKDSHGHTIQARFVKK